MDSIFSLRFSMTSELIEGQNCRSFSSSLWKTGAQAERGVAGTMPCSVQQLHHLHLHYLSFSGNSRGDKRNHLFRAGASINALGEAESKEHLWQKYFADPSAWWDNRMNKRNRTTADFKHQVTGEVLWILSPSTPPWVRAILKEPDGAQRRKQCVERIPELQDPSQVNRQPKNNNGNMRPPSTRSWRRTAPVCDAGQQVPKASTSREAVAYLKNRLQQGITIDDNMYADVLQRCLKERDLVSAKQVHDCILKSGMEQNQYVANSLLRVYIRCGRVQDAHPVFDKLVKKNVINWTTMIGGYAESGYAKDAMEFYNRMRQEGTQPNEITYLSILKACANPVALKSGKEIHAHIRESGLRPDVRVETALVNMYVKCGSIDDARLVFDKMVERNVISWTVMLGGLAQHGRGQEAFDLFLQMKREGLVPDAITYVSILNACASIGALEWVKEVHHHAVQAGLGSDLRVATALVHMYAKSGSIEDARLVFDSMVKRDVISWTVMIGGLAQHGRGQEAYGLFLQMQREGSVPDAKTYVSILNASASTGALQWVREVHSHAVKARLAASDLRVGNALVHMYAKSGSVDDARLVFEGMAHRDVISWNVMIGGLAQHGNGQEAFSLFLQMQKEGFIPDATTCASILSVSASTGSSEWVKEVHKHAVKEGLLSDLRVGNALVHIYAKSGSIDDARLVFNEMMHRDVVSWTAMIGGFAHHGRGQEALQLFEEMKSQGVKPDGRSFVALLSACSHAGLVDEARCQFSYMTQDYGIEPSIEHYNCMVDILGRAGHLEEAKLFIANMPMEPVESTWGALLGACRTHGNLELAEHAARELSKLDPKDASTYVLLSNIYAAAGKWDQVSLVRSMMQERGIRKEPGRSWIEIDNKIHRFVVGDTSHPEAKEIYAELQRLIKLLKTEGYIPDTRLVLHNINEEDKELALCSHSEKLAIAYGLMHTPRGKPVRVFKNLRVCQDCHTATKYISKVTGREIVARDANRFHHFKDGACSCGDYW